MSTNADQTPPLISWLSLDDDDNDPVRFWSYVIAALQTNSNDLGLNALATLQSSPTPNLLAAITLLISDLPTSAATRVLVLDDYHLIQQDAIHASLQFFLDHLPANVRLALARAICSRSLARLTCVSLRRNPLSFSMNRWTCT